MRCRPLHCSAWSTRSLSSSVTSVSSLVSPMSVPPFPSKMCLYSLNLDRTSAGRMARALRCSRMMSQGCRLSARRCMNPLSLLFFMQDTMAEQSVHTRIRLPCVHVFQWSRAISIALNSLCVGASRLCSFFQDQLANDIGVSACVSLFLTHSTAPIPTALASTIIINSSDELTS